MKPFTLSALLNAGKLTAAGPLVCPGKVTVGGHSLNCSHPPLSLPVRVETDMAEWLRPDELTGELELAGFASGMRRGVGRDSLRPQPLGGDGILATVAGFALAYRTLILDALPPIRARLESVVGYGTAQLARVCGVKVTGKADSARGSDGAGAAWFGGFLPSRGPEVALAVMLHGISGGSDAASIAGRLLGGWHPRRL